MTRPETQKNPRSKGRSGPRWRPLWTLLGLFGLGVLATLLSSRRIEPLEEEDWHDLLEEEEPPSERRKPFPSTHLEVPGPAGTLHVAELDEQSWFAVEVLPPNALTGGSINACDVNAGTCSEVATGLPILTAITFGKDGTLWATKNALIPGLAEVVAVP